MCINDWRFGRLIRTQVTDVSLTVGQSRIFAPDPNRVGISFMIRFQGGGVLGSLISDGVTLQNYGPLVVPIVHFTLATHGDYPTREFRLTSLVGTFLGGVAEYIAPADYLAKGLEEFETQYGKFLAHRR